MSFLHVEEALSYFRAHTSLLEVDSSSDVEDRIFQASNENRLRFAHAILCDVALVTNIPDAVVLGGLRSVVDPTATVLPYSIFAEDVPQDLRLSVIDRFDSVFAQTFSQRCAPILAHRAKAPLCEWNQLCFMWWEILPRHGVPFLPFLAEADLAILDIMGRGLGINNIACKEAALHGLAHWHAERPVEVCAVMDRYWDAIPLELRDYASAAKIGNLQ